MERFGDEDGGRLSGCEWAVTALFCLSHGFKPEEWFDTELVATSGHQLTEHCTSTVISPISNYLPLNFVLNMNLFRSVSHRVWHRTHLIQPLDASIFGVFKSL
jgi:hypothetical protein